MKSRMFAYPKHSITALILAYIFSKGSSWRFVSHVLGRRRVQTLRLTSSRVPLVPTSTAGEPKEVIVIGGGWAGFGAASHLASAGVKVTLLDAQPSAGGLAAGWETSKGNRVEVGIHGFWRSYQNIERLITEELRLDPNRVFTPYVRSALYTKDGLSVVAPILEDLPRLPAPFGPAIYPRFSRLGLLDRASALGLSRAFLGFDGSEASWRQYDKITARELFRQAGVSQRLYDEFLEPLLLVLPMCPGEDCAAAAALSCFQYFALEHQGDFDVRWLRGSASELIFAPWARAIEAQGGCRILGGKRVSNIRFRTSPSEEVEEAGDYSRAVRVETTDGGVFAADAVVLAVGITAAKGLIRGSPQLAARSEFQSLFNLRGVDVVAVRMFFRQRLAMPRAASVAGGGMAPGLEAVGLTFYHLNELQDVYREREGSVVEVDMYHANTLLPLEEEAILQTALIALNKAVPELKASRNILEDFAVVRAPQEKALVEGKRAAAAACRHLAVREGYYPAILPVEEDEPHVAVGRAAVRRLRALNAAMPRVNARVIVF